MLRHVAVEDVDNVVALNGDEDVMRDRDPPSPEAVAAEVRELVTSWVGSAFEQGQKGRQPQSSDIDCGAASGDRVQPRKAHALVDLAFNELADTRVWAQTMAVNVASLRVLENVGMKHIRTRFPAFSDPLPGTRQGEVVYAIQHEEWVAAH